MWKFSGCGLLLLITCVIGDGHVKSCFEDQEACNQDLRELLISNDEFWFGEVYAKQCPIPNANPGCENVDPGSKSILKRFYSTMKTEDELMAMVSSMSFLDVTFSAPAHNYFACGHDFYAPELTDHKIDPLSITPASQAALKFTPEVRWWNYDPNMKYTVMIWDAGHSYLHGLYINVHGGMMSTGTEIQKYSGPLNSSPYGNPYLFIVMPQNQTLDVGMVGGVYGQYMMSAAADGYKFRPNKFLEMAGGYLQDPIAANVMITTGDLYATEQMREWGIYDSCPLLVSEMKYLKNALEWSGIESWWETHEMHEESKRYLATLDVVVEPIYHTDDIKFESCCHEFSYLRSHLIPNPFSHTPERPVKLRSTPRVNLSPMNLQNLMFGMQGRMFTLMLVDFGSIYGPPADGAVYRLHWLVVNINGSNVGSGRTLIPHFGANPFSRSDPRMYAFLLFDQSKPIGSANLMDYVYGMCGDVMTDRCRYHLNKMIMDWGLGHVKGVNWYLAEQDDFARQRIYREWWAMPKQEVCMGVPGYADPCPMEYLPDPMQASGAARGTSLSALFVAAVGAFILNL